MSDVLMSQSDVANLAASIVELYAPKLDKEDLTSLRCAISVAIIHAQYDAALAAIKEFKELTA